MGAAHSACLPRAVSGAAGIQPRYLDADGRRPVGARRLHHPDGARLPRHARPGSPAHSHPSAGLPHRTDGPGLAGIQPELAEREELGQAAALGAVNMNVARAVGPAFGGAAVVSKRADSRCADDNGVQHRERHAMTRPTTTPTVQRADDKHHYEIQVDGRTAGFTAPRLCSATRATTPTPTVVNCENAGSCRSSPAGAPNIEGLNKLRYVVEQTFALLHHFKRLAVRWERRTRTPRCLRLPRLQPHLLPTAQEGCRSMIEEALIAAVSIGEGGGCSGSPTRPFATHPSRVPNEFWREARCR
ncbi:hypothetical protein RKD41_000206 [Streptomyces tendae]